MAHTEEMVPPVALFDDEIAQDLLVAVGLLVEKRAAAVESGRAGADIMFDHALRANRAVLAAWDAMREQQNG